MLTGCTDPGACNYDSLATINDSSCVYPTISTITQNGTYLEITISGTYIWNTGEITQTIIPTSNGWYWCIVTDINDCIGDTSFYEVTNIVSVISEITNTDRILLRITDMLGQETPYRRNTILFYIYDDGTVEKKIKLE
jgi:hypothetical protein